jgi:hypothetical protein
MWPERVLGELVTFRFRRVLDDEVELFAVVDVKSPLCRRV